MKEVKTRELQTGVRLAQPITNKSGVTMLKTGTVLTHYYIERLKNHGIHSVFVEDDDLKPEPPADMPSPRPALLCPGEREAKKNNDKAREAACSRIFLLTSSDRELQNFAIPFREERNLRRIRDTFKEIASQRKFAEEFGVLLQTDLYLFEHSLRVGLLAGVMGLAKNLDPVNLYELVLGGLLFDIGMTAVPEELIRKKRQLNADEQDVVRQHTVEGYRILTSLHGIPLVSAKCALLHHERYRGEGYPFGLKSDDLPEFSQIVGLADLYDALISPRHHRKAFTPVDAVEYLFAAGNYEFAMSLIWVFLKNVYIFPLSSVVQLSSGQIGVVSESGTALNHRPIVRIILEADGTPVDNPYELNLFHSSSLTITGSLPKQQELEADYEYIKSPRK